MTSLQTAKAWKLLVQELVEDGAGFGEEFGAGEDVDEEAEGGGVGAVVGVLGEEGEEGEGGGGGHR